MVSTKLPHLALLRQCFSGTPSEDQAVIELRDLPASVSGVLEVALSCLKQNNTTQHKTKQTHFRTLLDWLRSGAGTPVNLGPAPSPETTTPSIKCAMGPPPKEVPSPRLAPPQGVFWRPLPLPRLHACSRVPGCSGPEGRSTGPLFPNLE